MADQKQDDDTGDHPLYSLHIRIEDKVNGAAKVTAKTGGYESAQIQIGAQILTEKLGALPYFTFLSIDGRYVSIAL